MDDDRTILWSIVLSKLLIVKSKLIFEYSLIPEKIMILVNFYIFSYLEKCLNLYSALLLVSCFILVKII